MNRMLNGDEFARSNTSILWISDDKYQSTSRRPPARLHGRFSKEWGPGSALRRAPNRRIVPGLTGTWRFDYCLCRSRRPCGSPCPDPRLSAANIEG